MSDITEQTPVVFNPPEKSRTYVYIRDSKTRTYTENNCGAGFGTVHEDEKQIPVRFELTYTNVTELIVRPSGNHRIKCDQGMIIIPPGWIAIEIKADEWTI